MFDPTRLEALLKDPNCGILIESADWTDIGVDAANATTIGGNYEHKAGALVRLVRIQRFLEALYNEIDAAVSVAGVVVGEALMNAGRGGGFNVDHGSVLAGAQFRMRLKIDDLAPTEAILDPVTYASTIEAAQASAEQRLIMNLDAMGLGRAAPRVVDYIALAAAIESHEGGPAEAISGLKRSLIVDGITVAEVVL